MPLLPGRVFTPPAWASTTLPTPRASSCRCADCHLLACKISDQIQGSPQARSAAQRLIFLRAHRVATSSMDTYAAAIHRFTSFCTGPCGLHLSEALPPGRLGCISTELVELWLGHASKHYKLSTIKVTLAALADWHKSKGAPHDSVALSNPRLKSLGLGTPCYGVARKNVLTGYLRKYGSGRKK